MAVIIAIAVAGFNIISKSVKEKSYENKIKYIENMAANYGDATGDSAVFVDTLVKNGYLDADNENGDILDPRDNSLLNCYIVDIYYDNSRRWKNL